ncbi:MAG: Fur family transcriptional regulator [Chitinispirillaceae bacterium]
MAHSTEHLPREFIHILRENGGRVTPIVTTLLSHLYQSSRVHSPQQLKEEVNRILRSDIGFPTIYRALDRLMQCQLVYRMYRDDGQTYFFICRHPRDAHHHHFICSSCSKVYEIDMCLAGHFEEHVSENLNASITKHIIQLEGLCRECRKHSLPARRRKK